LTLTHSKILLTLMYLAGLVGMHLPVYQYFFRAFTPIHIAFSCLMLLLYHGAVGIKTAGIFLAIALLGFGVEVLGVKTGLVFGAYSYGSTLGPRLLSVPVSIGLNWLTNSYLCYYMVSVFLKKHSQNHGLYSLVAALLMVVFDVFIEPVAMAFDFWQWQQGSPPLLNFIGWFVVSLLIFYVFFAKINVSSNKIASHLFTLQLLFFVLNNLIFIALKYL
jgi:bisanhydrobacterioruberin hydratase